MRKYVFEFIFIHRDKWHFESQAMKVFIYCDSHLDFLLVGSCLEQSKTNGCTDNCSAISLGEEQTSSPTADSTEGEHRTYENLCRLSPLQHQWRYAQGYIWTLWKSESNFEFHTPKNRSRDMCSLSLFNCVRPAAWILEVCVHCSIRYLWSIFLTSGYDHTWRCSKVLSSLFDHHSKLILLCSE